MRNGPINEKSVPRFPIWICVAHMRFSAGDKRLLVQTVPTCFVQRQWYRVLLDITSAPTTICFKNDFMAMWQFEIGEAV